MYKTHYYSNTYMNRGTYQVDQVVRDGLIRSAAGGGHARTKGAVT